MALVLLLARAALAGETGAKKVLSGKDMKSKLGVLYLIGNVESQGMLKLADTGKLPIFKVGLADLTFGDSRAVRVKKNNPKALLVIGMSGPEFKTRTDDPVEAAKKRWKDMEKELSSVSEENRKLIDFLEAWPNMWGPSSVEEAKWYVRYTECLAEKIASAGYRPVVATYGVGGIPADKKQWPILDAMIPALRAAKQCGGAWACHGYTLEYSKDYEVEKWYSLRYRQTYAYLREKFPEVADLPMILSEGGVDKQGDPDKDGWQARGSKEKYEDWLTWYDSEICKDPYVLGVTLFKIGSPDTWKSFDLEPVAGWLAEYLTKRG